MSWESISPIIISVGVITAAIAAIANVIVALINNNRLRAIEKNKLKSELTQYRHTKLYSILEDIEKMHGFVNYTDDFDKTFTESTARRMQYVELYKLSRPLIESKLRISLDELATLENEQFVHIKDGIMRKDLDALNKTMLVWGEALNRFCDSLSATIQEQIILLIES